MADQFAGLRDLTGSLPKGEPPPLTVETIDKWFKDLWDHGHGHPDLDPLDDESADPEAKQRILDWYAEHNKTCKDPGNPLRLAHLL